ncbi:unnamed protein product [Rotaria sordida]|uniref:Uncharacterized protein n=1 Tax=Rotaria sordida TaxID=392033 RepID=A0A813QFP7_9BILA|nr:unnamed protein product [Rotaria sordida]CAF1391132.1 unnamed protein product [Rotaria sordida]
MAANDHGHVNNLDEIQMETLKCYWIALINAISTQSSLPVDQIISSVYGDEFFHAIGYENPDVFTLRWLRAFELAQYIDPSVFPKRLNGTQPDFEYIPPTADDEAMIAAIRADVQGKANAQTAHQEAAQHYLNVTMRWARGDTDSNLLAERTMAAKQLRNAFEKLIPYISTRTHYHRNGAIKEQIFQDTYDQICASIANNI